MKTFPHVCFKVMDIQFYKTKLHLEWSVIRLKALQMAREFYPAPAIEKASKKEKSKLSFSHL
jgi:hypothetical protein